MKLIAAALMLVTLSANAQTSLADAVAASRKQTACVPVIELHSAVRLLFELSSDNYVLRGRIADLERQLAERK